VAQLAVGLDLLRARRAGGAEPWLTAAVATLPSLVERAITAASECHRAPR
jgi:hypothetical protein